jgi:carboxyl-terminal processing protease
VAVAKEFGWPLTGYAARGAKRFQGDLVVLTNGGSASASEIFAAAVADNKRGKVVGVKSAGAVLASNFVRLQDGWSLQLPLMEYVTPGGKRLEGTGVAPQFTVDPAKVNDDQACYDAAKVAFEAIKKEANLIKVGGN